jgi:hypothetical protein
MITVREVFSRAFGEVPEGNSCHIGNRSEYDDCEHIEPTVCGTNEIIAERWSFGLVRWEPVVYFDGTDIDRMKWDAPFGPDISNRDAEAFRGFFGAEYDNALDQLQEKK